jgi:hypothetical protein
LQTVGDGNWACIHVANDGNSFASNREYNQSINLKFTLVAVLFRDLQNQIKIFKFPDESKFSSLKNNNKRINLTRGESFYFYFSGLQITPRQDSKAPEPPLFVRQNTSKSA